MSGVHVVLFGKAIQVKDDIKVGYYNFYYFSPTKLTAKDKNGNKVFFVSIGMSHYLYGLDIKSYEFHVSCDASFDLTKKCEEICKSRGAIYKERNVKSKAEYLADGLESYGEGCTCYADAYYECSCDASWPELFIKDAAIELRWLDTVNRDLKTALETIKNWRDTHQVKLDLEAGDSGESVLDFIERVASEALDRASEEDRC